MIDAPGPWGTGPFVLAEGHSAIDAERATISREPLAATWLQREERTPTVRLVANSNYWDKARGPRLEQVVFRNDLSPEDALELVCTTEGEVDIVTEVPPAEAAHIQSSEHAKVVSIDAVYAVAGVINRDATGLPLGDKYARQALNLALDRDRIVQEAMFGWARPLAGLTPPSAVTFLHRLRPYRHDPELAAAFWSEASRRAGGTGPARPLRVGALGDGLDGVARRVAVDLTDALGVDARVFVYRGEDEQQARRLLAEKTESQEWDILLIGQGAQSSDAPPLELHRAFVGASGEFRAGPVVPKFEDLYANLARKISRAAISRASYHVDRFVYDKALALFLCAPRALYAVNKHVAFQPYRTTFELPECRVSDEHWSRR